MSLDFAVESHWMGDSPNFFQYVDARFGIDYALPLQGQPNPTPTAVASPAVSPPPTATPTPMVPLEIGTPASTPKTASPTPAESEVMPANTPTSAPGGKEPAHSLMKKYYLMGIKALKAHKYVTALADLKKAVKYKEKVAYYYYAEAYATIGVIYEFHSKAKNHLSLALANYKMASKIDPDTLTVKKYYKKLKAQLAKPVHAAKLPKSAQVSAAPQISEPAANSVPAAQPAALAPTAVPSAASNPAPAAAPAATPNNNTIPIDLGNGK
jgi:tetratricopeptide (TPR) repeat protein